jgi:hypothetical protein
MEDDLTVGCGKRHGALGGGDGLIMRADAPEME